MKDFCIGQKYFILHNTDQHLNCICVNPAAPADPFEKHVRTPQMVNFNKAMSSVRASIEWLFGDIVDWVLQLCRFLKEPKDWTFFLTKDVHCLCLIKKYINLLIWQHNLRVFWGGSTHLRRMFCFTLGRITTFYTLKNSNTCLLYTSDAADE